MCSRLADATNELGTLARLKLQRAQAQWCELDEHMAWCDEQIAAHGQLSAAVKAAAALLGIGPVTASAVVANMGDLKQFKNGAQFGFLARGTDKRTSQWVDSSSPAADSVCLNVDT